MATCPSKSYSLDPIEAATICAKIKSESGIDLNPSQPTGNAEVHGCHLAWGIADGIVTISVISKPFYISCATIFGELDQLFATTIAKD